MTKKFAPRVSKKKRKTLNMLDRLDRDVFKVSDQKLFSDARLDELNLSQINVKDQVRTKFNDSSLRDLAENIQMNGLIQPLVVYLDKGKHTLICGERRFRAMTLIRKETAPCFILENKTKEELMAIQFSENSSREELHYIDKADGILNYQNATKASERQIVKALGISKSDVHRSLLIARLPIKIKEAAKAHNIEKYVLIEWDAVDNKAIKKKIERLISLGTLTKRSQLKKAVEANGTLDRRSLRKTRNLSVKRGTTANAFIKAMSLKKGELGLDPKTQKLIEQLVEDTKEMMEG